MVCKRITRRVPFCLLFLLLLDAEHKSQNSRKNLRTPYYYYLHTNSPSCCFLGVLCLYNIIFLRKNCVNTAFSEYKHHPHTEVSYVFSGETFLKKVYPP